MNKRQTGKKPRILILGFTGRTTNGASTDPHDRVLLIARVLRPTWVPWYLIPAGGEANLARRLTFKRRCRPWVEYLAQDLRLMPLPESLGVTLTAPV
jgi:hypothetical protein